MGKKPHERASGFQVSLGLFVDEDVYHAVGRHVIALENRRHPPRIDVALADEEPLCRIAYRRMRGVKHDVAVVVRGTPRREEAHVDDCAGDDAEKRVATPYLKHHHKDTGNIRPRRAPLECGIGVYDEPCDYDGRDDRTKAFDGRRNITATPRKKKEWQRPQSKRHRPGDGDDSCSV